MARHHHSWVPVVFTAAGVAALLLVASLLYTEARRGDSVDETALQSTFSPPSNENQVVAVTSATPQSASTTLSSQATPVNKDQIIRLPESAMSFLANFYSAYNAKDTDRLNSFFTAETEADVAYTRAVLFTGKDPQGAAVPSGPTLFQTKSVSEVTTEYTVLGAAPQEKNWVVTVKEKRRTPQGEERTYTTLLTLQPASESQGPWLVSLYTHPGGSGKYNGFFIQ